MEWSEARDNTVRLWRDLRDSIDRLDEVDLLREINQVCDLCDKAKELEQSDRGEWGRCEYCIAYEQFGGCTGISLRMSECVVDQDRDKLRELMGDFIARLEALNVSGVRPGLVALSDE